MHAMILAAGLGTRLRPITDNLPKPLVPVVGIPNIIRTVRHLQAAGFDRIVVNTHWRPEVLKQRLGDGAAFNVEIRYSDEPVLLGTGGGIKKALPLLGKDPFVVINGDALFAPHLKRLLHFHETRGAAATLVLRRSPDAKTYGAIGIDSDARIRRMVWVGEDTPNLTNLMFCGVHVITPEIARRLPDEGCIVRKTYAPFIAEGGVLAAVEDNGYFCDLGTKERLLDANVQLVKGDARLSGFTPRSDGIYIGENVHLGRNCHLLPGTVLCDRASVADSVCIENAVVLEDTHVTEDLRNAIATPYGIL